MLKPEGNRAAGGIPVDFNRDGKLDLAVASGQYNLWAIIRALTQKTIKMKFSFYLFNQNHRNGYRLDEPDFTREISFRVDLNDARIEGILPSVAGDFNGDGFPDAFYARNKKNISVLIQNPKAQNPLPSNPSGTYKIDLPRLHRIADLDANRKSDVVLYDWRASKNRKFTVLLNTGKLK